jgi:hypothetical protein
LFDVIAELDAEWAIVPGAAEAAINFGRGENKTSPLGERNDSVDVWCRHNDIKPQRSTKSTKRILTQWHNGAKETLNLQPGFSLRRCAAA